MKQQHTPGPWRVTKDGYVKNGNTIVGDAYHYSYDSRGSKMDTLPWEANAKLIAAAPELLEALKWLLGTSLCEGEQYYEAVDNAERLIAKIEDDETRP